MKLGNAPGLACALVVSLAVPVSLSFSSSPTAGQAPRAHGSAAPRRLAGDEPPAGLTRADWNQIRAKAAAAGYRAFPVAGPERTGTVEARNPRQGYGMAFRRDGIELAPQGSATWRLGLSVDGYGYEGALRPPLEADPRAEGQKVEYQRGGLTEWYVNGPGGLEQGFEIEDPGPGPARGKGPLVVAMAVRGDLDVVARDGGAAFVDGRGEVRLRYSGLKAWDADGRPLGSRIEVGGGPRLRLVVDASQARFPVTVDPVFLAEGILYGGGDPGDITGTGFGCAVSLDQDTVAIGAFNEPGSTGAATGAAYVFVRNGGVWAVQARLVDPDGSFGDQFGTSIALFGDTVVVAAPYDDGPTASDVGSVTVFVRSGTTWSVQQKVMTADGGTGDAFGYSVGLYGDTFVAGAPSDDIGADTDRGSVYAFVRSGTSWTQQEKITAADGVGDDQLGFSVALWDQTLAAGAPLDDTVGGTDAGSAYVFVRSGTVWTEQQKLLASDASAGDALGSAVSVFADTVAAGAPDDLASQGSVYVFVRSGTTWTEQQKLTASDGAVSDKFGASLSLWGETVLAGSPFDGVAIGSAYAYVRAGTTWSEQQKLVSGGGGAFFGIALSLYADTAVVGGHASGVGLGTAHAFLRAGATWTNQQYIQQPYPTAADAFAYAVSVSGDTLVVGAPFDNTPDGADAGSAYVFVRVPAGWIEQAVLRASDATSGDNFGFSVTLDGDTAVVGAPGDDTAAGTDAGSAYVFVRTGTTWTEQQKLVAADAAADDALGKSVSLDGDTAVVGAPGADIGGGQLAGAAYVFVRSGTTWTEEQKLQAPDALFIDRLGTSVSVDGNTALLGAPYHPTSGGGLNAGAAYVFSRSGTTWTFQQQLVASDGAPSDLFGSAASVSGDTALIGAPFGEGAGGQGGAAYVFVRSGIVWSEQQKLWASDGLTDDEFGAAVSVSGDLAAVGAPVANAGAVPDAGAVYQFERVGTAWTEGQKLLSAGGTVAGDGFGFSVSMDAPVIAAGAPGTDVVGGDDSGSVTIFRSYVLVNLGVTKTDGLSTVAPGQVITYTITVSNAGPEAAQAAGVTDTLPPALLGATWTCSATAGSACSPSGSGSINDTVNLLAGGTATYLLTATVSQGASGTLANTATATPALGTLEADPTDNSATDIDTLVAAADVKVTKTDSPDPVLTGGALVYVVTVSNDGPSDATAVTLTDTLPSGVAFVSSTPGPPTCTVAGVTLTCDLAAQAAGTSTTVTVNVTVNATGGILINTASVGAAEGDPDAGNNSAFAATAVGQHTAELTHGMDEVYDLAALPGPAVDEDVFRISQQPYSSYEVLVDATSGDIGAGSGPALERLGADGTSVLQTAAAVGVGASRSLRWSNTTASVVEGEVVRVRSLGCGTDCGPDDVYRIRVYETTNTVPRFNNTGTQITVFILYNPTNGPIAANVYYRNTAGVLVATQVLTLGPKATQVVNTSTVPGASGVSGAITIAHNGRYGDLVGKTVALEPATGFSFDSALEPRPALGGRRPGLGGP